MTPSPPAVAPLVSVTIPVFNGEQYLEEALTSVLAQGYHHLEVIVVDDGSSDRSVEIVRAVTDVRCRSLRQARSGAAAARNLGVAESRGDLLAFLDADDVWTGDKLERQVRALESDHGLDMVFGHYVTLRTPGTMPVGVEQPRPGYSMGTMLIRRGSFQKVGPLSTRWRVGEFVDWYARAEDAGLRHAMLPEVLMWRRVHDANLTGDRDVRTDYARIVRAAAARRARLRDPGV